MRGSTVITPLLANSRVIFKLRLNMPLKTQKRLVCYDEAIRTLNSLQTNSSLLKQVQQERQKYAHLNAAKTLKLLEKSGMTVQDLDSIPVIHVSGTKGKGSTCAFLESILKQKGFKTGFYSSPHLVSVTERIRINTQPVSQELFCKYSLPLFERLCQGVDERDRPPYFQFLTVLAYHIFWREKVDVAIMEVGIGGLYDYTNVVRRPILCGITSLGLDHTSILGNRIEDIAHHKAGIMKPGSPTYVDYEQPKAAMEVLRSRSVEVGSPMLTAPPLRDYDWGPFPRLLSLSGSVQERNASLALQLARAFVSRKAEPSTHVVGNEPFKLDLSDALGLRLSFWPGRSQTITFSKATFYLDGAHTLESIEACEDWFHSCIGKDSCQINQNQVIPTKAPFKVLIFNVTKDRNGEDMLSILSKLDFDLVVFCTTFNKREEEGDNTNYMTTVNGQVERCQLHKLYWDSLINSSKGQAEVMTYINEALAWLTQGRQIELSSHPSTPNRPLPPGLTPDRHLRILVTGSFHLVGGVLEEIKPEVFEKSDQELRTERDIVAEYQRLAASDDNVQGLMNEALE